MPIIATIRIVLATLVLLGSCHYALAQTSPQQVVQDTATRLFTAVNNERDAIRQRPERVYELVESILLPVVDRERIAQLVLGRHWRQATPEQRARFMEEFQTKLLRTYTTGLRTYSAEPADRKKVDITYLPPSGAADGSDVLVRTQVRAGERDTVSVDYRMHLKDGRWLVYDVVIAGISAVMTFRAAFAEEIRQHGLEGVLHKLAEQNRQQAAGGV